MIDIFTDEYFMKKALQEAETAFEKGEIPVGAVIVIDNKVIVRNRSNVITNCLRITIGSFSENEKLLTALKNYK